MPYLSSFTIVVVLLVSSSLAAVPVPTAGSGESNGFVSLDDGYYYSDEDDDFGLGPPSVQPETQIFHPFRLRFPPFQFISEKASCLNRCDTKGHDRRLPCQCNAKCTEFNDCCPDYSDLCLSCSGRCDIPYDSSLPCQCNQRCKKFEDCCHDAYNECKGGHVGGGTSSGGIAPVTDADLSTFSEDILANDVNNAASLVTVNLQGSTCFSCSKDAASEPLLTVQAGAYRKPTIEKLLSLHNNYVAPVGQAEVVTSQETQEETAFLDAILTTPPMQKAEKFLTDKGFITTRTRLANGNVRTNNKAFRDALQQIWFGLYSRERRTLGSSGFEHVFLGEVKDGKVSGFHNWVFFGKEESNNKLNYKGRIGTVVNLGAKGRIIKHKFDWNNTEKPISSMFVGTSPEFEMALYTVCFYSRPGVRCPVKLNGKNVNIQTHYFTKQGKRYVASAFPDI